jgi:hypothetical protein
LAVHATKTVARTPHGSTDTDVALKVEAVDLDEQRK